MSERRPDRLPDRLPEVHAPNPRNPRGKGRYMGRRDPDGGPFRLFIHQTSEHLEVPVSEIVGDDMFLLHKFVHAAAATEGVTFGMMLRLLRREHLDILEAAEDLDQLPILPKRPQSPDPSETADAPGLDTSRL